MEKDAEIIALVERYKRLEGIVLEKLNGILKPGDDFPLLQITHRIKTVESIMGKLIRKPDLYPNIYELRDILGLRAICYILSDVDLVAERITGYFRVDWTRSKDKREIIDASSFSYLSVHFICALPEEEGELSNLWFEIQIRTMLQHCWAEIEHDLGYKSEIEVPRKIRRNFSRASSLLETTDIIFAYIKERLEEYKRKVKENIENASMDEVFFDGFTLTEFTDHNETYRTLLNKIAGITRAHITEAGSNTEKLLKQMEFFEIRTFGDMIRLIEEEGDLAMKLAREALEASELDELSPTVGYHYLFKAKLISGRYGREKIRSFFRLSMKSEKRIEDKTEAIKAKQKALAEAK